MPGYPIRTPSDQRSVDSSPRTIAASHVLHRLLMPRHPPCALDNLTNTHIKKSRHKCAQKQKMLASTVQFSTTTRTEAAPHPKAKPAPTVPERTTSGCPLRTQQCAAPDEESLQQKVFDEGRLVFPLFLEQPDPEPEPVQTTSSSWYWGPPPPAGVDADTRRDDHTHLVVFGEAP